MILVTHPPAVLVVDINVNVLIQHVHESLVIVARTIRFLIWRELSLIAKRAV